MPLGVPELLIIGGIVVLLFGAKKVPEFFASLGKGIKEFKKAMREVEEEAAPDEETKTAEETKTS